MPITTTAECSLAAVEIGGTFLAHVAYYSLPKGCAYSIYKYIESLYFNDVTVGAAYLDVAVVCKRGKFSYSLIFHFCEIMLDGGHVISYDSRVTVYEYGTLLLYLIH